MGQVFDYIGMMFGSSEMAVDDTFFYFITTRLWVFGACIIGSTPLPAFVCRFVKERLQKVDFLYGIVETLLFLMIFVFAMAFLVSGSYNPFLYFRF